MKKQSTKIETVADYLSTLEPHQKKVLNQFRKIIKEAVPGVKERISYQMPCFEDGEVLLWFAAFKNHYGLYPKTRAIATLSKELKEYKTSKGAIQFPADQALPEALIRKIIKVRQEEISKNT